MAGVSCKAGTEAIVGLSNPSYNREGFRILFPGAAASGPSPSNPAFPSPGSLLWGVTFCSILTAGNRRCPQPRKVRVASVPLTSQSSITREARGGGGRCPWPSRRQPPPGRAGEKAVFSAVSGRTPGSLARSAGGGQRENGGGLSRSGRAKGDGLFKPQDGPRSQTPSSITPAVGLQGSPLPAGTDRGRRGPVSISDGGG